MAAIGLSDAAKVTGRNQSRMHRAMKTGPLSLTVEGRERRVDTTERWVFGVSTR
jgi:hypothetical protein